MTEVTNSAPYPSVWRKPPFISNGVLRLAIYGGAILYVVIAIGAIDVNWARLSEGAARGARLLSGFFQPNFTSRWGDIMQGMQESLTMTVTSTVVGILISIPIGIGAARNLSPLPIYLVCRAIIAVSRTFQEVIIAILFVAMVGFGPFAGFLTLSFATIGFLAKLLAEDIEDIDSGQAEAIRATGASWLQLVNYAVQPQVMPRMIGLGLYRLDINFRESAVVGIVGGGGIGWRHREWDDVGEERNREAEEADQEQRDRQQVRRDQRLALPARPQREAHNACY